MPIGSAIKTRPVKIVPVAINLPIAVTGTTSP